MYSCEFDRSQRHTPQPSYLEATMLSPIKTATRAAILAIALGGATLTAMPAQAQPSLSFEFSIGGSGSSSAIA